VYCYDVCDIIDHHTIAVYLICCWR